ncbi:MAG: IS66 family transposase, partial [Candidatus Omnitrophica bacterium]|nr:IS66 family transposase [Candidatus Omnitrophota bacterium]
MTFEALLKENQSLKNQIAESCEKTTYLKEQIDELASVIEGRNATIKAQRVRLDELIKRIYGRRSEKLDPKQLVFDEVILEADKQERTQEPINPIVKEQIVREHIRRTHPGRKPLPEHLQRIEHYLDIDEKDKFTADGKERPMIGVDVTEKLDYRPSVFVVNRYVRPKYGADDDIEGSGVRQHPPVEGPIDKCMAESSLLAHIITEKYEHHMPLYRQELKCARLGVDISRKTMTGWMMGCAKALKPLHERMREEVLGYDIVLNDDTPVRMLDPGTGKTRLTRLWCTLGGENLKYTMYNFTLGRGREGPLDFFKGYKGTFMSDAYAGYEELFRTEDITSISCWTHARRYFAKAQDTDPKAATEVLTLIAQLYKIEKKIKRDDPDTRLQARTKESRPQLAKILLWLRKNKCRHLPQSQINQAIQYALKIRRRLTRYTKDGRIPIDNNLAENAIRPIALGRKNWMFVGSERGGEAAAILMTFCTTCRKLKINTWQYLKDVLQ